MSFPIALIHDDFTNNTIDPCWVGAVLSGSATVAETSGQARITLPSSTAGTHTAYYRSAGLYDLTGDGFVWNIETMVATGVAATAYLQLLAALDGSSQLLWRQVSNAITARYVTTAGVDTQLFTATWSASTYKYLRIREASGTIYWDSSTNGTSWTNRASVASPFAVTALYVQFAASCGNVASPGSLRLDDVNLILPAPSATWRETTGDWSISNRLQPVTLASDGGKQGVLVTADTMDSARALGGTLRYFGGPLGSASGGYLALTEYASLVLAQASPFVIPIDGRVDLPALVDARFMRLYHRSTDASAHTIYEFVPRRIVQADDIEAESIQAINIAAQAITADKIFVINLEAVSALMGSLTMDGPIDITTGSIIGGGGVVTLDSGGLAIQQSASVLDIQSLQMVKSDGTVIGRYGGSYASAHGLFIEGTEIGGEQSFVDLTARAGTTDGAITYLRAVSGAVPALITMTSTGAAADIALSASAGVTIAGASAGLSVGTTGAGAGQIATSGSVGVGVAAQSNVRLFAKGQDATSSNYAFFLQDSAGATLLYVRDDGAVSIAKSGAALGFYGSGGTTKPTVTGSRAANAALASLLTALAGLGLLTDSSS